MTNLSELIERVEKATGPDNALDVALLTLWEPNHDALAAYDSRYETELRDGVFLVNARDGGYSSASPFPRFTASLDAAIDLVEWVLPADENADHEKSEIRIQYGDFGCNAVINRDTFTVDRSFSAAHKTPALALILALLRSLQHQEPRDDR